MKVLDKDPTINLPKTTAQGAAPPVWKKTLLFSAEFVVCAVAVVVVLESLLAFAGLGEEEKLRMDPVSGWVPMEGKQFTHRGEGFSRGWYNSLGMPDVERSVKKPPGVFRIALVGDSFTEGFSVQPPYRFGNLLEKRLNSTYSGRKFEVLNFGVPAYNFGQKYIRLKTFALNFEPDLVLMQCRPNEMLWLGPELNGWTSAKPNFFLGNDGQLLEERNQQTRWNQSADGRRMRNTFWLRRNSRIWGVVAQQMAAVETWQRKTRRYWKQLRKGEFATQRAVATAPAPASADTSRDDAVRHLSKVCRALVWESKNESEKRGAKFAVLYFPTISDTGNSLERLLFEKNSEETGINYYDLTPVYAAYSPEQQKKLFSGYHFSKEGYQVAADKIFDYLTSKGMLEASDKNQTASKAQ